MNAGSLNRTIALGAITGMRTMAGLATLTSRHGGLLRRVVAVMAGGELIADKTSLVGDRIDPIPLAGRAFMGALVGGMIAREERGNVPLGGLIGASAAVIAAHLAYHARKRLPCSSALGGALEDGIVITVGAFYASRAASRPT